MTGDRIILAELFRRTLETQCLMESARTATEQVHVLRGNDPFSVYRRL